MISHPTQSLTSDSKNSKVKLFAHPQIQKNSHSNSRKNLINDRNQSMVLLDNYLSCSTNNISCIGGLI